MIIGRGVKFGILPLVLLFIETRITNYKQMTGYSTTYTNSKIE